MEMDTWGEVDITIDGITKSVWVPVDISQGELMYQFDEADHSFARAVYSRARQGLPTQKVPRRVVSLKRGRYADV